MLLKSCGRCGKLIPYGLTYCSTCRPIVEAEREARRLESKRESDRRYNNGKFATQVHHKQAIQTPQGWDRRLDYNNLELLCTQCHNDRHNRFKKKKRHTSTS